jgi:hypothetical protein
LAIAFGLGVVVGGVLGIGSGLSWHPTSRAIATLAIKQDFVKVSGTGLFLEVFDIFNKCWGWGIKRMGFVGFQAIADRLYAAYNIEVCS